jgi:putative membrane protein
VSGDGGQWRRLDSRMIWVDAAQTLLSLAPAALAIVVFGVRPGEGGLAPVAVVAVVGVGGAVRNMLRWLKTRYRITDEHAELRTGLIARSHRSIRRDRIRSVEATAKLRHRLAGLRLVTIGAGQQQAAVEAALSLDAVSNDIAEWLHSELLAGTPAPAAGEPAADPDQQVLARIRWSWTLYNVFNIWAYVAAAGVLWGGYWLAQTYGLDPARFLAGLVDWQRLGLAASLAIGLVVVGVFGVVVLAAAFVSENWDFRLARVRGPNGTVLRTSQGLLKTRQVDRDEQRIRGMQIAEPLLWRWLGMADTNVITTGLKVWSLQPASTILPRGPISAALPVAAAVLGEDPSPFEAPLRCHPRAALRRRVAWALLTTAIVVAGLGWLAAAGPLPGWAPLAGLGLVPVALAGALVAYRALGHALAGSYLVVRSGLVSRSTVALQSRAVVGWRLRQSVLQRRLGLATLSAATAAGTGEYVAPDLDPGEAVELADRAVPGLLGAFRHDASEHADG